jgi:DNA repair exonuclease SbcCD ATPase subunit
MDDNFESHDIGGADTSDVSAADSAPVEHSAANSTGSTNAPSQPSRPSQSWESTMEKTAATIESRELPPIDAPTNWSNLGEDWKTLPRHVQERIAQRETEVQQGFSRLGHDARTAREMGQVIDDFNSRLPDQYRQMPPTEQIKALYAANEMLLRDPLNAIATLAQMHNVDLSVFGTGQQQVQQVQSQYQQFQQQRQAYLAKEIESIIHGKQHWPQIEDEVMRQVNAVRAQNPSAFEIDSLRVVREAIDRAEKLAGIADQGETVKKAAEARRINSMNVKTRAGKSPSNVSKDIWSNDSWTAAYDKAQRS